MAVAVVEVALLSESMDSSNGDIVAPAMMHEATQIACRHPTGTSRQ